MGMEEWIKITQPLHLMGAVALPKENPTKTAPTTPQPITRNKKPTCSAQ
jgi:hypothetical protein